MERQVVKADPTSGIASDVKAYVNQAFSYPRYRFDLMYCVIYVSIRTLHIVDGLPAFDIVKG
jgi:predicted helicase